MRPCHAVEIVTPKQVVLNGLLFGSRKPKRVLVWVHGLSGSAFSNGRYLTKLVDANTTVLTFNNRGHDIVSGIRHADGTFGPYGGEVHETFTDCADDIEGAVRFARRLGAKEIFVGGSSTGSQKTVHWASRTKQMRGIRGYILAVPLSDHASAVALYGKRKVQRALDAARTLVGKGKPRELLPRGLWHQPFDAQRFLSLYSGEGAEEVFPYWDTARRALSLARIKRPTLVLLAGKDEYGDRPAQAIARWFEERIRAPHRVTVVPRVGHGFKGGEITVAREIRRFMLQSRHHGTRHPR